MRPKRREMHLGVFVPGTGYHSAGWRYDGAATSNNDLTVIQEIARHAERGKFDKGLWGCSPFHPGFKEELPHIVAIVDLEDGVRMNAQMRGVTPDEMRIGLPVQVIFEQMKEGLTLPAFVRIQ